VIYKAAARIIPSNVPIPMEPCEAILYRTPLAKRLNSISRCGSTAFVCGVLDFGWFVVVWFFFVGKEPDIIVTYIFMNDESNIGVYKNQRFMLAL